MSCGINDIDRLEAFRRGTLVEVCGSPSSGRTTLLHGLLSRCTGGGEAAAVIDVTDSFDPVSASRQGIALSELLWVRCGMPRIHGRKLSALEQGLVAAVLLLQGGGFGMLVVDMANVSAKEARNIPLAKWFQLRRAVEGTQTLLVILVQQSNAGSSSASIIDLSQAGVEVEKSRTTHFTHIDGDCVIRTLSSRAEVVRGQMRKPVQSVRKTGEFSTDLHSYR
ncbi:DNA recombination/repair protein RecA [Acidicapsa ligni]|uniref:DNA recombination/repair protein RecA n=1 Tax=Acidicapsa ligni TaxID=542300 RepID=UPI0021E08F34|nr:DNA recombination/repair protein RecA [Acidicapsa ligni]